MHEVIWIAPCGCSYRSLTTCHSGFNRDDEWGFRAMEPSRCCISSIALVLLKTGIVHHPPTPSSERPVTIDYNQMATAQKLLLFWRKPAVGCSRQRFMLFHSRFRPAAQMLVGWFGGGFGTTRRTHPACEIMGKKGLDTRTQFGSCICT